ncbi:hypothetical protein [Flavobacterium paronense]|uniref:Uncharacterized protein n=2 Tax=Flavobacterium paronense TaxID=1392775 RepID=A0ABV5GHH9_9FLAO
MLIPISNAFAQDLNTVITKENPKHPADLPNDGITSPTHKKYMGKIVFSKKEAALEWGKEIESDFTNKFTLGGPDPIYLRVYMNNSLSNYITRLSEKDRRSSKDITAAYSFKLYLDGIPILYSRYGTRSAFSLEEKQTFTTFRSSFYKDDGYSKGTNVFKNFLSKTEDKLTPGDHKIKVEVYPMDDYDDVFLAPMVASGEFTLTVSANAFNLNDDAVCLPKAMMQDKKIEAGMLKAFNNSEGEGKIARIVESDWTIERNQTTGIILRHAIDGIIAFTKNGKCKYQVFGFAQDYDGTKFQDRIYLVSVGSSKDINCSCLK